jgi:capsular exopolysaccharide synthesis family protein
MSRLYDALKEASRFRQDASGNAGEGVWEALGINGVVAPLMADDRKVGEVGTQITPDGEMSVISPELVVPAEEEVLPCVSAPLEGSFGTPTKTALDSRARLLPQAVAPVIVEHYRKLRTKILQEQAKKPFKSVILTSASPQEGKTVTVLNLGLSFAMLPSFKVLVVDGDLRRGTLGRCLGVDNDHAGLSNLIDGSSKLEDVVLRSDELPMHFIVRGNSKSPAAELLHSPLLGSYFREMAEQFDMVLVDSPPVNLITDVQLLAGGCDAVLLIARAFSTTRKAFEKAVQDLLPFRVIGTVLNAGEAQSSRRYNGYY